MEKDKKVQGKMVPVSEVKTFCYLCNSVMKQGKPSVKLVCMKEILVVRLGHTKTLSCIMHGLVLREERGGCEAALYSRENGETGGCTRIIN